MNTTVSFEIAKLLKEKRFEGESDKYYVQIFNNRFKLTHYKMWLMDEESGFKNTTHYPAPTIAEVIMWLYEKHGTWIYVSCREIEDNSGNILFIPEGRNIPLIKNNGFTIDPILYTPRSSPKEAYEAAIKYCLINLINL